MKTSIIIKVILVLPLILFVDYVLMVVIGCTTCLFGFSNDFYSGAYCVYGKIILALSALFFGYIMYSDIVKLYKQKKSIAEE